MDKNGESDFSLREWSQQNHLLKKIPEKAVHKGFMTLDILDIHLTCIGVTSDHIALGTSVGIVYWYNRIHRNLQKLKFEGTNISPISCISVVSCEYYMIAAGKKDGVIAIFQIPKIVLDDGGWSSLSSPSSPFSPNDTLMSKKVQIFSVTDLHKGPITALHWSSNGMKLFSGDMSGIVVETGIDFCSGISKSSILLEEKAEIVQLSYMQQNLLISSIQRTVFYSTRTKLVTKIGNQERKSKGNYGGIFASGLWNKNLKIFASRPGLRIWVADQNGAVQNTLIFKDLVKQSIPSIPIINRTSQEIEKKNLSLEKQFGVLYNYLDKYLVTFHNNILYVLDPVKCQVVSSCSQLKSILAIDVHKDEIFIVETTRNIVRLSPRCEDPIVENGNGTDKPDYKIPEQPFRLLASKIKEKSKALPKFNSTALISTVRSVLEADLSIQDGYLPNQVIPLPAPISSQVPDINILPSNYYNEPQISPEVEQSNSQELQKFDKISKQSFKDVLLVQFKPERRKVRKRRGDYTYAMSDTVSLTSQESSASEGTSPPFEKEKNRKLPIPTSASMTQLNSLSCEGSLPIDVETKEEMLAKLLNWSELLPSSNNKKDKENSESDQSSETLVIQKQVVEIESQSPEVQEDSRANDSITPTPTTSLEKAEEEEDSKSDELPVTNGIHSFQESFDGIYDDTSTSSTYKASSSSVGNSLDFFGPPSGSSNMTLTEKESENATGGTLRKVHEICSIPSLLPVQDMKVFGIELNDGWSEYKLPCSVTNLCICDNYIICIDHQNSVYYSRMNSENHLCWIKGSFQATHITSSPDGSIVWKICPWGILSSLSENDIHDPFSESSTWETIAENVRYASVGNNGIGLLLKNDNSVTVYEHGKGSVIETLQTTGNLSSVHIREDSVWALGMDGRVFYRSFDTWNELKLLSSFPIVSLSLGPQGSVWIVDIQNQIRFIDGFTELNSNARFNTWNVTISDELFSVPLPTSSSSYLNNSLSQWTQKLAEPFRWGFQMVQAGFPINQNQVTQAGYLPILSSSNSTVAFTIQNIESLFLNKTCVTGHKWESVASEGLKNWKWVNIYAESIYNDHGFLWMEEVKGKVFYLQAGKGTLQPIDTPCSNISTIATAPEAIWILDTGGTIYARCNINAANELGSGWDKIELTSMQESVKLTHISCGSEVVWSCDENGNVYIRQGSLNPPSSTDISPAWIKVDGSPNNSGMDSIFTKVYVGPNDCIVWALDSCGSVYAREAVFPDFRIGTDWKLIPTLEAVSLAISEKTVLALSTNGEIFRRSGISDTNFVGDSWKRIPGHAKVLTVSVCDEVWALNSNGILMKHSMEMLYLRPDPNQGTMSSYPVAKPNSIQRSVSTVSSDSTEWELLG